MILNTEVIILFILCLRCAHGLRVTNIEVPRYIMVGDSATLKCHFILEGEKLYSLKWWKDDRQFYQYIPKNDPKTVVYAIPGVSVNEERSSLYSVEIVNVQKNSRGEYRCEIVGEAPTFTTKIQKANLSIIDPPDGPPVVRGQKQMYHPGEIIRLNCTSYRSRPAPALTWTVLGMRRIPLSSPSALKSPSYAFFKTSSSPSLMSQNATSSFSSALLKLSSTLKSLSLFGQLANNDHKFAISQDQSGISPNKAPWRMDRNSQNVYKRDTSTEIGHSNYTKIDNSFLIEYPESVSKEEGEPFVHSVTVGVQFPASLAQSTKGKFILRCVANISTYTWATEVGIDIAKVPVADPQQLPTLHGTGSPRGLASRLKQQLTHLLLIIHLIIIMVSKL